MKKYSWSLDGLYKEDPELVAQELEKLDELTPENVVEHARNNESSILHNMFEWDNDIAGEKYRKIQASSIITSIRVQIIDEKDEEKPPKVVRAFVQMKKQSEYQLIETAIADVDKYQILLEKAYKELGQVKNKYTTLQEIQELLANIPEF